jgi:hypothetical protein
LTDDKKDKCDKSESGNANGDAKGNTKMEPIRGEPVPNDDDGWLETQIQLDIMIAL